MDPRFSVRPGQPLALAAEQVNWINRQMRPDAGFRSGAAVSHSPPFTTLPCKNVSGQDVPRWGVLRISGLEVTPANDGDAATNAFQEIPVIRGDTPTSSTFDAFVVAVEPIAAGTVGHVAVDGVVQVKIDVRNTADSTAGPKDNSRTELISGGGNATILWKASGTGAGKWALVRLGGRTMKLGTISSTWTKGGTATVTEQNGDGTARTSNPTFTAKNYFADVLVTGGTRRVACQLIDSTWVLVAAEC